jgi:hypothetical protein
MSNPYNIKPGGNCPVQAEGLLPTGEWYYFRARGCHWSLEISNDEEAWARDEFLFSICEEWGEDFDAGWMPYETAVELATRAINEYMR